MLEVSLRSWLLGDSVIAGIVGTGVYPLFVPQESDLPAITYMRTGTQREANMRGATGKVTATLEITCWAARSSDAWSNARALANAVRKRLDGFTNQGRPTSPAAVTDVIRRVLVTNEMDVMQESQTGTGFPDVGVELTLEVAFEEAVASYQ